MLNAQTMMLKAKARPAAPLFTREFIKEE